MTKRAPLAGLPPAVVLLILACALPEVVLSGADWGLWGSPRWRSIAVAFGAFWPGLLADWRPNYALQPYLMFLTYGFLHAGFLHFAVNMLTLASLGPPCVARVGTQRFLVIYALAILGGAVGFALLAQGYTPMVGASGALFGLAGAILGWELADRRSARAALSPVLRSVLVLTALNLILWWAMSGHLAWQTHLGGFVAGWVAGRLLDRRLPLLA